MLDAINIGRMGMGKKPDVEIQKVIQQFAVKYGLFGLMTALPAMPNFMEYEAVYLPKNHFIKEETMYTEKYLALALTMIDKPTIVWNFHSLLLGIQMMCIFMLTDSEKSIKLCRHCTKVFVASRTSAVFCSPQCKNKHNVYKSRAKKNKDGDKNA